MLKITPTIEAVSTLVGNRPDLQNVHQQKLFCTISPNPKALHTVYKRLNGKKILVKIPYGKLPQRVQFDYCVRVVERCYLPFLSIDATLAGTWELNESGNVHFHFLIHDKLIQNKTHLEIFRRDILNCEEIIKNMSKGKKMIDYMNNIVFITKPINEVIKYMDKDHEYNKDIYSNYYFGALSDNIQTDGRGSKNLLKVCCNQQTNHEQDFSSPGVIV